MLRDLKRIWIAQNCGKTSQDQGGQRELEIMKRAEYP